MVYVCGSRGRRPNQGNRSCRHRRVAAVERLRRGRVGCCARAERAWNAQTSSRGARGLQCSHLGPPRWSKCVGRADDARTREIVRAGTVAWPQSSGCGAVESDVARGWNVRGMHRPPLAEREDYVVVIAARWDGRCTSLVGIAFGQHEPLVGSSCAVQRSAERGLPPCSGARAGDLTGG